MTVDEPTPCVESITHSLSVIINDTLKESGLDDPAADPFEVQAVLHRVEERVNDELQTLDLTNFPGIAIDYEGEGEISIRLKGLK